MKRFVFLAALALVVLGGALTLYNPDTTAAEKPKGQAYSLSYSWTVTPDSTLDSVRDTNATQASGLLFTGLENYSTVSGYVYIQLVSLDTGAAYATGIDTTTDSLSVLFYTDWGDTTYKHFISKLNNFKPVNATATSAQYFNPPGDSILGDRLYLNIIQKSDSAVDGSATYKATVEMRAKP